MIGKLNKGLVPQLLKRAFSSKQTYSPYVSHPESVELFKISHKGYSGDYPYSYPETIPFNGHRVAETTFTPTKALKLGQDKQQNESSA